MSAKSRSIPPLVALVAEFEALGERVAESAMSEILARSPLHIDDLSAFVTPNAACYSRQRVARTETFEILVAAWLPGQRTGAHDHAGSASAFKILSGTAHETVYARACDSLLDPVSTREWREGEVGIDAGDVIHAVGNDSAARKLLVSVHVYVQPLRQLRRFSIRPQGRPVAAAFQRRRAAGALSVAIIGGGFSGTMVAAQLLRRTPQSSRPLHIVLIDRQASIAEGAAYRTLDASHLLNVPASNMSAWPDRPDDFLQWARRRDPRVGPDAFLQRQAYGEYLRDTLFKAIAETGGQTSLEIHAGEVTQIERRGAGGWRVHGAERHPLEADAVVLATGHRPVVDPMKGGWSGSRTRYIEDPWGSGALNSIEPDETVCLLGTGLTAVDTLLSLMGTTRTGRVMALSRRGLMPAVNAPSPLPTLDAPQWLDRILRTGGAITARASVAAIRGAVLDAERFGRDWRQVIDGLRPYISRIATALPPAEMSRFLRHVRPIWEVTRHRMAPAIAERVKGAADSGLFSAAAARILSARGAADRVTLTIRRRAESAPETLRFDWIVNCTGPSSGRGVGLPAVITGLIRAGLMEEDSLGLGVRTTPEGRALARGRVVDDLVVVGSLRKADQWESTAVPELRLQAARAAELIMQRPVAGDTSSSLHSISHANRYRIQTEQPDVTS